MGLVIFFVCCALYVAFMFGIFAWVRWRLLERAKAAGHDIEQRGGKVISITPSGAIGTPAILEFELGGKRAAFHVRRFGRDQEVVSVHFATPPLPRVLVRAEGGLDRLGKALGLNREVQIGDAEFDAAAYIQSSAPDDVVRSMLADPTARQAVRQLLRAGYKFETGPTGIAASVVVLGMGKLDSNQVPELMHCLEQIAPRLPAIDRKHSTERAYRFPRIVLASLVAGAFCTIAFFTAVRASVPMPMNDTDILEALGVGLLFWLVAMVVVGRSLRGRSSSLFETGIASFGLFFAVPFFVATALFLANESLDSSASVSHRAKVTYIARKDDDVRVVPWDAGRSFQKVSLTSGVKRTLKIGDEIEVAVRAGALGWPWTDYTTVKKAE